MGPYSAMTSRGHRFCRGSGGREGGSPRNKLNVKKKWDKSESLLGKRRTREETKHEERGGTLQQSETLEKCVGSRPAKIWDQKNGRRGRNKLFREMRGQGQQTGALFRKRIQKHQPEKK